MTDSLDIHNDNGGKRSRPGFLTVLGVLSFITIGVNILLVVIQFATGRPSEDAILEQRVELTKVVNQMHDTGMDSFARFFEQAIALNEEVNESFYLALTVSLITYLVGLVGVIFMWKARKLGFHLYILYSLLALGGVYVYASPANVSSISIILGGLFSALFIFMYSRNLHWMTR